MSKRSLVVVFILSFGLSLMVAAVNDDLELPEILADYHAWMRANPHKSFIDSVHPLLKDVYFNEIAEMGFDPITGEFELIHLQGSIFVKESLDPRTLTVSEISVMRKVGDEAKLDNWAWGFWERDEESLVGGWLPADEAGESCAACHARVAEQDYTFLTYLGY